MIRATLTFAQRGQGHGHRQVGLAGSRRANAEGHVVCADGVQVFLLAHGLGDDARLLVRGQDPVVHQVLQRGHSLVLDDAEGVGEVAVAHGAAGLQGVFEQQEQVFGALDAVRLAFQLDPALARGGLDAELGFEGLQVARVVVEKLLRHAGVFEMQCLSCHGLAGLDVDRQRGP